jgi:hypothetical protein
MTALALGAPFDEPIRRLKKPWARNVATMSLDDASSV